MGNLDHIGLIISNGIRPLGYSLLLVSQKFVTAHRDGDPESTRNGRSRPDFLASGLVMLSEHLSFLDDDK
ncbi:hypothetical protein X734_03895 [Mesorhizobium sp. L2C084A000]|nr:hypothetical protein X734_03895 [Mesorhizobium sp. L2C084A000]